MQHIDYIFTYIVFVFENLTKAVHFVQKARKRDQGKNGISRTKALMLTPMIYVMLLD